jgi:hypothetical protein
MNTPRDVEIRDVKTVQSNNPIVRDMDAVLERQVGEVRATNSNQPSVSDVSAFPKVKISEALNAEVQQDGVLTITQH